MEKNLDQIVKTTLCIESVRWWLGGKGGSVLGQLGKGGSVLRQLLHSPHNLAIYKRQ